MHRSMVFMSRNFQLSPLTAERYSRVLNPRARFGRCLGRTERPCFMQSPSEIARSLRSVSGPWRSIFPVPGQTALTTKCEWTCSASVWVAMSTSLSGHACSANSCATWWANAPVSCSSGAKDWT